MYKNNGVELRLGSREFSAPENLRAEIENTIVKLLGVNSKNISHILPTKIAQIALLKLNTIVTNSRGCLNIEVDQSHRDCMIPKTPISVINRPSSFNDEPHKFLQSGYIFNRILFGGSSLEVRVADIALEKVRWNSKA